jgi:hypothetical protein
MRRIVRVRSDGVPEITGASFHDLVGRGDVSLLAALTVAWVACTALQLAHVISASVPLGALTLVLIRTLGASGSAWLATRLLRRG